MIFSEVASTCGSIILILATAAIGILFVWLFCVILRKAINALFGKNKW